MKSIASLLSIIALGFGLLGCPPSEEVPFVNTTAAPYGVARNTYSEALDTTCSTAPLPWTVSSGALPTGLSLDEATGVVTGTPAVAGNFIVVFAGMDSTGKTEKCSVSFVVHPRTDRLSVDTFGNSVAVPPTTVPSISSKDGRFIAFTSIASLIPGVTGQQIYVHDRQTGQPSLVSIDNFGIPATAGSLNTSPTISEDGRYIAFVSNATNLVPGVTGQQVYLHDMQTSLSFPNGQTTLVSKDSFGIPATAGTLNTSPMISADGQFIAFVSTATNLVPPLVPPITSQQIYLHDRQTSATFPNGQTTLVSKDSFGIPATAGTLNTSPVISADGRFVAFVSTATNLVPPLVPPITSQQIYLHEQPSSLFPNGQTTLVSKDSFGIPATAGTLNTSPVISADGQFIAFVSTATNLALSITGQPITGQQIYLHEQPSLSFPNGQTTLVSKDSFGIPATAGTLNTSPTISANGLFIAFVSNATNLDPLFPSVTGLQIYRHDTQPSPNGQTTLVSKDESEFPASTGSPSIVLSNTSPKISADGQFVAFVSSATNLVTAPPAAPGLNIYVRALP